ncbi:hypothetical protein RF55_19996, partial [Lasius niger]
MRALMYQASKSELADFAAKRGLDTSGTLDDIRRRVREYLDRHPEEAAEGDSAAVAGPSTETFTDARDAPRTPVILTLPIPPPRPPASPGSDDTKVINQIRKWGCHFDGRDPLAFLERVEELKDAYGYTDGQLLKGLPELLKGETLLWYRNNRDDWTSWADFDRALRVQFLPRRYQAALRREVTDRRQKPGEKFAKYATDLLTLMRRAGGFTRDEQIERVYENMQPEYKIYVRYDEAASLAELQARASEYEDIERQRQETRKAARADTAQPTVAAAYNKQECCWRCKQRGHTRFDCKRPAKKFCSQCGKDGIHGDRYHALLDTGSEISFINQRAADRARLWGCESDQQPSQIQLADGATTDIPGTVTLPVHIHGRLYHHAFAILPTLDSPMLIGADLWARTGICIPPPRPQQNARSDAKCGVTGGLAPRKTDEEQRLTTFLARELAEFDHVHGPTDRTQHRIRLRDPTPIKQRYRPRNPAMQAVIDKEVEEMEAAGVIEPSRSAWSSPVVVVKKKDGKYRFCIDFRKVNDVTEKDAYPLPQVTATLDKLRGARYLSTLDLKSGYWQVPLTPDSRPITAFTIPGRGLF